jgi:hypothetical protein
MGTAGNLSATRTVTVLENTHIAGYFVFNRSTETAPYCIRRFHFFSILKFKSSVI